MEGDPSAPVGPVAVTAENRSTSNVTVYVVRAPQRQRIGQVASLSSAEMTVPESFTNDHGGLSIQVLQLGGPGRYLSEILTPQRDDRIVLTVQPSISSSAVMLR